MFRVAHTEDYEPGDGDLSESFKIVYHYFKVALFVHSTSATESDHPIFPVQGRSI